MDDQRGKGHDIVSNTSLDIIDISVSLVENTVSDFVVDDPCTIAAAAAYSASATIPAIYH